MRPPSNNGNVVARPPNRLPSENSANPMTNIRLRPRMSPARPPRSNKPPNANVYALIAHVMSVWFLWKYSPIWGRAMFTIVVSSTIMS